MMLVGNGRRRVVAGALAFGVACAACGGGAGDSGGSPSGSAKEPFLAFASNFRGYRKWEQVPVTGAVRGDGGAPHFDGPRVVYVNQRGGGSAGFPVGTMIVKEVASTTGASHVFAMVKRGGGYNAGGAQGWEWFELEPLSGSGDDVKIVWRGVGPPDGETYGGDAEGGCNGCHAAGKENDSVLTPGLTP